MNKSTAKIITWSAAWGAAAAAAGALGLLARLPAAAMPAFAAVASLVLSVAIIRGGWLDEALRGIGLTAILAANAGRLVGFAFLWLHARGRLPAEFAERAGWGDVAAAVGAILLLAWGRGILFPWALLTWNVLGLVDLFVAVGTAVWLEVNHPGSMAEMTRFPICVVPLWAVPLLFAGHVHLLKKAFAGRCGSRAGGADTAHA